MPNATGCVLVNLARLDIVVNGDYYVAVAGDATARSYPALGVDSTSPDDKRVLTGYVSILGDGYLKRGSVRVEKHRCAGGRRTVNRHVEGIFVRMLCVLSWMGMLYLSWRG